MLSKLDPCASNLECSAGLVCNMEYSICIDEDATPAPADGAAAGAGGQ